MVRNTGDQPRGHDMTAIQNNNQFPSRSRLKEKIEFDAVFSGCHRSADRFFTVLYRPNDLGYPRIGLAIAKKKIPRAVARNRLKRLVRESFRRNMAELENLDIVMMAKSPADAAANPELHSSLAEHWQRIKKNNAHLKAEGQNY
jgi:ribonuclease P protein component